MYDFLIVGAGFAGCTLAERLAAGLNKKVLLVDKRNHIGGNAYDYYNKDGILVHQYGPHIFHTNIKRVWNYLSLFTDWHYYQHRVLSHVDGLKVPFPINLDTVNMLFGQQISVFDLIDYFNKVVHDAGVKEIKNARDMAVSRVGNELYNKFFKNYTKKQWALLSEELAPEVTARIPLRINRDPRYFVDPYQGVPRYGYTWMFQRMVADPNIHLLLNADYKKILNEVKFDRMIYTGPIDYFFDYIHGRLPYRSLDFEFQTLHVEQFQEVGTINYPNDYDFTRITEFKHLTGQKHPWTTIIYEYPVEGGEPFYPIPKAENKELFNKYKSEAQKLKSIYFVGRLAEYCYYNMDLVIERALEVFDEIIKEKI
ncbi:MAG: UDP-galactopyranose mutase [Pelotomaculum sp. PtaB.Bin104]|nr:MAG: UDP-galactopyranose mutase [Pelotomaculum sp. PtaB.Bin104]